MSVRVRVQVSAYEPPPDKPGAGLFGSRHAQPIGPQIIGGRLDGTLDRHIGALRDAVAKNTESWLRPCLPHSGAVKRLVSEALSEPFVATDLNADVVASLQTIFPDGQWRSVRASADTFVLHLNKKPPSWFPDVSNYTRTFEMEVAVVDAATNTIVGKPKTALLMHTTFVVLGRSGVFERPRDNQLYKQAHTHKPWPFVILYTPRTKMFGEKINMVGAVGATTSAGMGRRGCTDAPHMTMDWSQFAVGICEDQAVEVLGRLIRGEPEIGEIDAADDDDDDDDAVAADDAADDAAAAEDDD